MCLPRPLLATLMGLALAAYSAEPAHAQRTIIVEPRLGVTLPVGDLSGDRAEAGVALGAEARLALSDRIGVYAGLNRHSFRCPQGCAELGNNPRSSGAVAGFILAFPTYQEAVWWTRLGALSHRFTSDLILDDRSLGLELAGGVDIPINERVGVSPNAGLISHPVEEGVTARYLSFGVGLHYRLR